MGIEDLKRWHWIVIGAVVGLALGYVWNGVEPAPTRRGSAEDLLRNITRSDPQTKRTIISNIVIHPPQQAANGMANIVNYKKLMFDSKKKRNVSVGYWFVAEIPFVPQNARGTQVDPNMTFARYLDEIARRNGSISYWNGWWATKPATYAIWTAGSVLVIGILWPTVVNGLIGAGYGRPPREKKGFSLWKYKSDSKASTPAPVKPQVTAADQQRLEHMTEKLEHDLAAAGLGMTQAATDQAAATTSTVRKLEGGPLEVAPLAPNPDADDEIEIKGEYYPVLIHHKKHHDDPAPDEEAKKN